MQRPEGGGRFLIRKAGEQIAVVCMRTRGSVPDRLDKHQFKQTIQDEGSTGAIR